jgi:hypothetical protein
MANKADADTSATGGTIVVGIVVPSVFVIAFLVLVVV